MSAPRPPEPRPAGRRRPSGWSRIRETVVLVLVALVLSSVIQAFVAKPYVIPSGSMEATLHGCPGCSNDRVLVDKVSGWFTDPQPGDVVVFRGPDNWVGELPPAEPVAPPAAVLGWVAGLLGFGPADEEDFVKRVIAVGGQTVQCCDAGNHVLVDGEPLDEPYVYYAPGTEARQSEFGPVTVPPGQLWMMGDSRNNSADSRVPGHGAVPVGNVIGVARAIVLPLDRLSWLPTPER